MNRHAARSFGAVTLMTLVLTACTTTADPPTDGGDGGQGADKAAGEVHNPLAYLRSSAALLGRTFALDGSLAEWSAADRMDAKPGLEVPGYALFGYHDALNGKYHVAVSANVAIGPGTTFWLNTDNNNATGYRVWGSEVGAEFNINIAADGAPHLYTGADAEIWQKGPISHAYNADKTVMEFEFTHAMVSADAPISMWIDVNNATFLPSWYGGGGYLIDAEGVPQPPETPGGAVTLDGSLLDWSAKDRIDQQPGMGLLGYELYGRADADNWYFALRALPPAPQLGAGTTFWLNTDRDRATGHQVWGIAVGAEHNINIAADGTPHLYTGAAAQNWQIGPLPHGRSADGGTLEFAVGRALIDPNILALDLHVDVNDTIFLPADFTREGYSVFHPDSLPAPATDAQIRVAMVYSATSAARYFGDKAYSQLYAAMQHQAMQAGIPFVLLHEDALLDINKIKDFSAIFIPYMANVAPDSLTMIQDTLTKAVYHYGIGIITAGDFLTNAPDGSALPGDSYDRMKRLLGVTIEGGVGPTDFSVHATAGHPILRGYAPDESLVSYTAGYIQQYGRFNSVAHRLATVVTADRTYDAAWAITGSARSVHFASTGVMGDTDLAWRALLWSVYGDGPWAGLQLTRQSALFVSRCDMDQSQFADEAPTVYNAMVPIMANWKDRFNFVSSYYVNVGNNTKEMEYTDWTYSGPVYKALMSLGGEIGTHSYTHPDDTSLLSGAQLKFEFETSRDVIAANIGVPVTGAAVPGNPETLDVDVALSAYFDYVTADYSGFLAGYHGAIGFLTPDFSMVYLAPNMYFDFTMLGFWNLDATTATALWIEQYDGLVKHAPAPFVVWPWHDYGPTRYESLAYTEELFSDLLDHAWKQGAEFVTAAEAARRVKGFAQSAISVTTIDADTMQVQVTGTPQTGAASLRFEAATDRTIASVDGWPAFTADRVLLGEGDRVYTVHFADIAKPVAHLRKLPMRASLQVVSGDDNGMTFSFVGAGVVEVAIPASVGSYAVDCGDAQTYADGVLKLSFATGGPHSCTIGYGP